MEPHKKVDYATALCHAKSAFFQTSKQLIQKGFIIQLGGVLPKRIKRLKGEPKWKPALPWIQKGDVSKRKYIPTDAETPRRKKSRVTKKKATPEEVQQGRERLEEAKKALTLLESKKGKFVARKLTPELKKVRVEEESDTQSESQSEDVELVTDSDKDVDSDIDVEETESEAEEKTNKQPVPEAPPSEEKTNEPPQAKPKGKEGPDTDTKDKYEPEERRQSTRARKSSPHGKIRVGALYQAKIPVLQEGPPEESFLEDDGQLDLEADPLAREGDVDEEPMPCTVIGHKHVRSQVQWRVDWHASWVGDADIPICKGDIEKITDTRVDKDGQNESLVEWKVEWVPSEHIQVKNIVEYAGDMVRNTYKRTFLCEWRNWSNPPIFLLRKSFVNVCTSHEQ